MNKNFIAYHKYNRPHFKGENYEGMESSALLPSRVPSLEKIMNQFLSGRPIDQSLQRNLDYNEIKNNPVLAKGVDLADLPEIASAVDSTLQEVVNQAEQAKLENQVAPDNSEEPDKI